MNDAHVRLVEKMRLYSRLRSFRGGDCLDFPRKTAYSSASSISRSESSSIQAIHIQRLEGMVGLDNDRKERLEQRVERRREGLKAAKEGKKVEWELRSGRSG